MRTGFIYKLIDPNTKKVRYIGQTICPIKQRLQKHLSDCKRFNTHVACWINSLSNNNLKPDIEVLEIVELSKLDEREIFYIAKFREDGCDLTNTHLGGQCNRIYSEETKRKIANSLKGKVQSKETKEKRRIATTAAWESETLRKEQSIRVNKRYSEGWINPMKGKPSKKKGQPFTGDIDHLTQALRQHYSNKQTRDEMAIKQGGKPFMVYKINSILRANRYRKQTVIEKGNLVFEGLNVRDFCRTWNLKEQNVRKCLTGKRPSVSGYVFEYKI